MAGSVQGWRALSWGDRGRMALMMLFGLPAMATALRLFGYVRTRRWLERHSTLGTARVATPGELDAAERLARLAAIAGRRGPITATCLRQSLLVYWLLRRRGLAPEFKIGVRKQDAAVDAHAWVELEGKALAPTEVEHQSFPSH